VLEQVSVIMSPQSEDYGLTEDFIIPLPSLTAASSPGIVYVSFTRESPQEYALASFQCLLKFVSKELDPSTGEPEEEGYEDEYLCSFCNGQPERLANFTKSIYFNSHLDTKQPLVTRLSRFSTWKHLEGQKHHPQHRCIRFNCPAW
jgi:hypothetical protein